MSNLLTRARREVCGLAQGIWEIAHALDAVSVSGPPWRWRVVDTGSAERVAAVRAGTRKVGDGRAAAVTWPPPGENWEGGYRDEKGQRWVHTPNEGWREEWKP